MHMPPSLEPGQDSRPLTEALAARAQLWAEPQIDTGDMGPGWMTCAAIFANDSALNGQLASRASSNKGADPKTCAALFMLTYCSMFSLTTVPLLIGFRVVPDLTPDKLALQLFSKTIERDGKEEVVQRARVRLLSCAVSTDRQGEAGHPDADLLPNAGALCEAFRQQVEGHFQPLIAALHRLTGLAQSALWRLVGDSLGASFLEAGRRYHCLGDAKAMALTVLKHPGSPLTNRELRFVEVTVRDDACPDRVLTDTFRARGGCCRFYLIEGNPLCVTCVLQDEAAIERSLHDVMRRRLGLPAS